jgi:tetratricopeptide (TPR) repeat protein
LVEVSLRAFHYGDNLQLFIESGRNPDFLVLNPAASRRYFVNKAFAPTGNSELFRKKKDTSILRIFVLGESTTIGYPYFHNGSFHRWLQYRLMHTFPDRQFEIINISLTAVNSYTVLGFSKELVNYRPDAVLIYTGHNEYYGTLGVGSTSKIGNSSMLIQCMLALRQLRIVQLVTNFYEKVKHSGDNVEHESGQTLMQRMVADQQIPIDSKLFSRGIDQFVSNMDKVLEIFNSHQIPVFVSNLVSNEKDLKPFVSVAADSIRFPGFEKNYKLGAGLYDKGDWIPALQYLDLANRIYDGHAMCNFYLGKLAYNQGDYRQAKKYFIRAKDLDGLRFRAPSQINEAIATLCSKYKYAHLVDARSAFESNSDNQIIGNNLMLEHVHPNLAGYAILSDVFYEALKKELIYSPSKLTEMSLQQLTEAMPITAVDSLTGIYRIWKLKKSWPFNEVPEQDTLAQITDEQKLANSIAFKKLRWPDAMDELYNYYLEKNDLPKAKTVMESLLLEHPTEKYFYEKTASIYGKLGYYENASFYFKKAFAISPSFENARTLFVIYLKLDKPANAMPYLDYVIQNNVSNINFLPVKKFAVEIIALEKQSSRDTMNLPILNLIANRYLSMGNKDGALKYIEKVFKSDPKNKEALSLLEHIKKG